MKGEIIIISLFLLWGFGFLHVIDDRDDFIQNQNNPEFLSQNCNLSFDSGSCTNTTIDGNRVRLCEIKCALGFFAPTAIYIEKNLTGMRFNEVYTHELCHKKQYLENRSYEERECYIAGWMSWFNGV